MCRKSIYLISFILAMSVPAYSLTVITGLPTASWPHSPLIQTAVLPPDSNNANSAYISEHNFGSSSPKAGQTFRATTNFTLDKIAITISGAPTDVTFQLYDLGTGLPNWNQPSPIDLSTATALWEGGPLGFHYYGSTSQSVTMLDFEGAEEVPLLADHKYVFVITETANYQLTWYRTGPLTAYPGVSGYRSTGETTIDTLRGDAARNFGMAICQVHKPDPNYASYLDPNYIYSDPCLNERTVFDAKFARIQVHSPNVPAEKRVDNMVSSFAGQLTYNINCGGNPPKNVVINVKSHLNHWDPNWVSRQIGQGKVGACFAEYKKSGFVNNIKTIDLHFHIMLDPNVTIPDENDPNLGRLVDEALLYHELLHGQLLINAISNWEWQTKVCECNFDTTPMNPDNHETIYSWEQFYLETLASIANDVNVSVQHVPAQMAKDANGNFDIDLGPLEKEEFSCNLIFPGGYSNILNPKDPCDPKKPRVKLDINGHLHLIGILQDPQKPGFILVRVDPPSYYAVFGIEEAIIINPFPRCIPEYGPAGDITGEEGVPDCVVDFWDLKIMADEWLDSNDIQTDLYEDGIVDFKDFAVLAENWLEQKLWP